MYGACEIVCVPCGSFSCRLSLLGADDTEVWEARNRDTKPVCRVSLGKVSPELFQTVLHTKRGPQRANGDRGLSICVVRSSSTPAMNVADGFVRPGRSELACGPPGLRSPSAWRFSEAYTKNPPLDGPQVLGAAAPGSLRSPNPLPNDRSCLAHSSSITRPEEVRRSLGLRRTLLLRPRGTRGVFVRRRHERHGRAAHGRSR